MNCNKSDIFLEKWNNNSISIKRKLTEFSLQLTPNKFSEMINYKKILLNNLEPSDIEMTVTSDGCEIYNLISDSKMKSLCLSKAKDIITILEKSSKNPDEIQEKESLNSLDAFISSIKISNSAFGSTALLTKNLGTCVVVLGDTEINGIKDTNNLSFDILTFEQGYTHTFTLRFELENGDMYSFYSAISRDGAKGEKPKVYSSALVNGYYVSKEVENTNIY